MKNFILIAALPLFWGAISFCHKGLEISQEFPSEEATELLKKAKRSISKSVIE